jgi:Carbonic anhydrases/acetyltransferases, isoleucine patch superfamily
MPIYRLDDLVPSIDPQAYVFESADIIGDVRIGPGASIWPHVSIRGDNATITIGADTNIQEGSVLHVDEGIPLTIADFVTVGHQAMLHGCTIATGSLIGMQAIVLNRARIGRNCLIGAGAIVPEGREIPDNSLVIGVGKIVRELTPEEIEGMHQGIRDYARRGRQYREKLVRIG